MRPSLTCFATLVLTAVLQNATAQQAGPAQGWHHMDPTADGICGVGTEQAFELLKDRNPTTVVVAVLDGGVDIDHEELTDNIWINGDENGYIDDVHGWNFHSNAEGVNLEKANLEVTRLFRQLSPRFRDIHGPEIVPPMTLLILFC